MLVLLTLFACVQSREGTSVGNPGKTTLTLAEADGLEVQEARAVLDVVEFFPCSEAEPTEVTIDAEVDLLGAFSFSAPAGTWCGADVFIADGPIVLGEDLARGPFEIYLGDVDLPLDSAGFTVDGDDWVLELGQPGWLVAGDLVYEGGEAFIDDVDPQADELVARLLATSGWWADNGDGVLDETERDAGPMAGPLAPVDDEEPAPTESSSGCRTVPGGGALGWPIALLLWGVAVRRRPYGVR